MFGAIYRSSHLILDNQWALPSVYKVSKTFSLFIEIDYLILEIWFCNLDILIFFKKEE